MNKVSGYFYSKPTNYVLIHRVNVVHISIAKVPAELEYTVGLHSSTM